MNFQTWYDNLAKPAWTPPPRAISIIWMILYLIMVISFSFVFYETFRGELPWLVALPFIINLIANLLFFPIFSGLRNLRLATMDILVVLGTIVWMILAIWPHFRWVA